MTGEWVQLSAAASRISAATGEHVSVDDVHRLADAGQLKVSWLHDHYGVLKSSLAAYLSTLSASELATPSGEVLAESRTQPTVGGGPRIGYAAEREYRDSQSDYDDTPNEEGDEQQ